MKSKLILTISFLLATASTAARAEYDAEDDEDVTIEQSDIVLEKDFAPSAKTQALHVMIHKAGHLDNRPFVMEVNESCPAAGSTENESRMIDTVSACDVAQNTLEFDAAKSELAMLVRQPLEDGTCSIKPKKIIMQLESICAEQD